jgi:hypothetical protein
MFCLVVFIKSDTVFLFVLPFFLYPVLKIIPLVLQSPNFSLSISFLLNESVLHGEVCLKCNNVNKK